jgi:hypothetical protein
LKELEIRKYIKDSKQSQIVKQAFLDAKKEAS